MFSCEFVQCAEGEHEALFVGTQILGFDLEQFPNRDPKVIRNIV